MTSDPVELRPSTRVRITLRRRSGEVVADFKRRFLLKIRLQGAAKRARGEGEDLWLVYLVRANELSAAAAAERATEGAELAADSRAEQGESGDRDDRDKAQDQTVLSQRLALFVLVQNE